MDTNNGWHTAYIGPEVEVYIYVLRLFDAYWEYGWQVRYLHTHSPDCGDPVADTEATAYRLACECAAAEARARLGTEAAAPIVDALNTFLWSKTQLSLFDQCAKP